MNIFKAPRPQTHLEQKESPNAGRDQKLNNRRRAFSWSSALSYDDPSKNHKLVNSYLRRISHLIGDGVSLNEQGVCHFVHKKFIIFLEVPDSPDACFLLYATVFRMDNGVNTTSIMKKSMELNYMQRATRGACLGLSGNEITLSFSAPLSTLTGETLFGYVEDFMLTASDMNAALGYTNRTK